MGRFISPDTIIPNPANPQSFNRYSYCLNNPLKYIDPNGQKVYIPGIGDVENITMDSWIWLMHMTPEARGEVMAAIGAWTSFETEHTLKAARYKNSKNIYRISLETMDSRDVSTSNSDNWRSMYITNTEYCSTERYEWPEHVYYFPFREGNKWEGAWYKDYAYNHKRVDWGGIGRKFSDVNWAEKGKELVLSLIYVGQITVGILGMELSGIATFSGFLTPLAGPATQFFWGLTVDGLYNISEGQIQLSKMEGLYIPWQ
jgi:hypothetical protein